MQAAVPENCLGIEPSSWAPPPLTDFKYSYFFGRKGPGKKLECSCLLVEHVEWTESGLSVFSDDLYPANGPCPFEALKNYITQAIGNDHYAVLMCDDSNGVEQNCDIGEYHELLIRPSMIKRGNLLFADFSGNIPYRVLHVVADGVELIEHT